MTAGRAPAARQIFSAAWLANRLQSLLPHLGSAALAIGLSGGADSVALLLAASRMRKRAASLRAIHIDHDLQAASAQFVEFCTLLCGRLKIPLTVLRVRIRSARARRKYPEGVTAKC